jgi:phage head maturation protease
MKLFNFLNPLVRSHDDLQAKYNAQRGLNTIANGEKLLTSINEKAEAINEAKKEIVYVITSSAIDRYKEITDPNGCEKDAYDKAKKTVFFNHNYSLIVGRSLWEKQQDEKWIASLSFADSTDFSKDMWNLAKDGYIGMTSIGFMPKALEINALEEITDLKVTNRSEYDPKTEIWVWRKWELLEWSLVGVGANPDAYEISKVLQKGLVKSDEVKNYLSAELYKLEIEKAFTDQANEIKELKTLIEGAQSNTGNAELTALKKEIDKLKKLNRTVGIAGGIKLDYDKIVARAISSVSGRPIK